MRLKRVLGAVLSGAMVLSLAACGGGGDAETTAASKAEETSKEAAKETEAEKKDDAKETEAAKGGEEINKRIAYVVGNLGDKSFNDSGEVGMNVLREKGWDCKTIEVGDPSKADKWEDMILDVIDEGYYYIVASSTYTDIILKLAEEYPENRFVIFDDSKDESEIPENVAFIFYAQNEGSYMVGQMAAGMTETGVVAVNVGMDNPVIADFVTGFVNLSLIHISKETAPELIRRIAEEEEGRLELLVVGPMTNIAIALSMYPELKEKIRHIWFMGGAALGGNMTPTAEFNIWVDPVAAKLVIASGIPMTMVGLDVTLKAALNREDEQEIRSFGNKGAVLAADILDYMIRRYADGGEDALMHDALAAAAAVCPQCLVCHDYFVDVECQGEYTAGHTMVDRRGRTGKKPNVSVAMELDLPVFKQWLKDCLKQCG